MIKVLLFDADGVLITGEMFSRILAREHGISTEQTLPFFDGPFQECIIGNADLKETVSPYLEGWGWKTGVDSFLEYWFSCEHLIDQELIEYIQKCRKNGIKCYVATNQEKHRAEYMLNKLGFAKSFDKLYASSHLGHKKPDVNFFVKLLEDLSNVKKEEILFWDDSTKNIQVAREFGINAELYTSFPDFKKRMKIYPDFAE